MHLAKCLATYEEQLQEAQRATRVQQAATRVPTCRLEGLGQNLCRAGRRLLPGTQPEMTAEAQNIYSVWMRQLARHETKDRDCARFEKFHALRWNPLVFVWAEAGTSGSWDTALVPWLRSDKNYATEWGPVAERTYYGPREVAYVDAQGSPVPTSSSGVGADGVPKPGMYRLKRMHEVEQARTFLHATGTHLRDIMQLVEFGGGGGELEPTMRDLGFTGVHIIYDLPPMLLMQRFWIRHASLPVYTVGVDVQPDALVPRLARGRTFQVSSVSRPAHLPLVLQRTGVALKDTVFWATWSFTEAGVAARNTIRPFIKGVGRVFIAFWDDFKGVDNNAYLVSMVKEDFAATHSACVWRKKTHDPSRPTFYLVLVLMELGPARCAAEIGCDASSKHTAFMKRLAPVPMC